MGIAGKVRYIKGFLTIGVEGLNLEKFLNLAVANGINFWDVKRISMTELELKISINGYRNLKKIIKKTGSRVYIISKDGLPFLFLKMKKRKMMVVGFIIFILFVFMLSSFIWSIKITGIKTVSTRDVLDNLSGLGVKPGAFKLNIAVSEVESNMLIKMSSISWIKVKLKGTRAEIEVKERTIPPNIVPVEKPCNIIAKRDGIIEKIVSVKGDVLVTHGEPVKRGQVLVSGIIERENLPARYVHAGAEIRARTWYEGKAAVPLESISRIRNGNKLTRINLIIGSKVIQIKNTSITYKNYDKIIKSTKLIETDKFELPFEVVVEEYLETINKPVIKTPEEAKAEAEDEVEKSIIGSIPSDSKILNKKINISVKDNVVVATALIETIEDIGTQEEIK